MAAAKAKAEIKQYFEERHGAILYPDEISSALAIDFDQAIRVCEELEKEGQIAGADEA